MPSSDYASVGGGALKIKGSKPVGIEKKRKKKKASTATASEEKPKLQKATDDDINPPNDDGEGYDPKDSGREGAGVANEGDESRSQPIAKTKAEREQEERRRKRVSV